MPQKLKKNIKEILGTIIGALLMAIGISLFLLPNKLSTGGFSGIATITYYLLKIPMGTAIIIMNIPFFILGWRRVGGNFILKALIGTVSLSFFIDLIDKFEPLTSDKLLASIYGGVITGAGSAIILRCNSSTGGTDMISYILKSFKPQIKLGNAIVIVDTAIIVANVILFKTIEIGLYSAIAIYLMGKMIDIFFEGIGFTKFILIISDKSSKISKEIESKVERGVTGLYGKGMYENKEKLILTCAAPRRDATKIELIAKKIDKDCFIITMNAREVFGKGFK